MDDTRALRDIILDQCEAKEIRIEEIVKKTGLPEQYFDAIVNNVRTRLPAFPYIRTHLVRLATLLGLPPELLLEKYRKEFSEKVSGGSDVLPGNRFALAPGWRRSVVGFGLIAALLVVYMVSQSGFFGSPRLVIEYPALGKEPFIVVSSPTIVLSGTIDPSDMLTINGQPVAASEEGYFSKEHQLAPELNIIEFRARRFLGRSVTLTRQVYFNEPTSTLALKAAKKTVPAVDNAASTTPAEVVEP